MDKNVIEEGKKRFQQILEYTTPYGKLNLEADDKQQQDNDEMPPMDGGMDTQMPPQDGGMAPMDGGEGMNPEGGDMPQGAPMPGGDMGDAEMPQGGDGQQQTPEGFNPQQDGMGDISNADFQEGGMEGQPGPDDDVVDVSELTDKQDDTEKAVKEIGGKFDEVMSRLTQWEDMIKSNNEKIEDLKAEFEKRNPTQIEKLGLQTAKSYPFSQTPDEYWKEKEATSNYRVEDDDNGKEQGQYVITKNDIDGDTNWKGISDSLDDDAIYHPTLKNTMGYGL